MNQDFDKKIEKRYYNYIDVIKFEEINQELQKKLTFNQYIQ